MAEYSIVTAMGEDGSIGYYDKTTNKYVLPWKCKDDMAFFKNLTTTNLTGEIPKVKNVVIMGKNTYLSLPGKYLHNRINIVISSTYDDWRDVANKNIIVFQDFQTCLSYCKSMNYSNVYVIGGSELYKEALNNNCLKSVIVSVIPKSYYKPQLIPNIFFPLTLSELENFSNKSLLYKTRFVNVYSFK